MGWLGRAGGKCTKSTRTGPVAPALAKRARPTEADPVGPEAGKVLIFLLKRKLEVVPGNRLVVSGCPHAEAREFRAKPQERKRITQALNVSLPSLCEDC